MLLLACITYSLLCCRVLSFAVHRVMLLEFSQYLENYLWPNYSTDASNAHVLSIVVMVNEKFRERVPAWEVQCSVYADLVSLILFFDVVEVENYSQN